MNQNIYFTVCPICNNNRINELPQFKKQYLVKCANCTFVFAKKIPSDLELAEHYMGYGRNDYLSPVTIKRYHQILDKLEKFKQQNRMLDVGCGIGYFLDEAKKRDWEVYGTEYTDVAVDICKKKEIEMHQGVLDINNYSSGFFDVITSFEVIEHINNPAEEVKKFNYLLRDGGTIYITTPNFDSISKNYLGNKWNVITYPEHLSYYTSKTLKFLFKQKGFKKLEIKTTGISISRIKVSKQLSNQKPVSSNSDDEKIRLMTENKWYMKWIKNILNTILSIFKKGDTIKGYFIK